MTSNLIGPATGHQPGRPAAPSPAASSPSELRGLSQVALPRARTRYFGPSINCVAIDYTSLTRITPTSWPRHSPIDPDAALTVRKLAGAGLRLVLTCVRDYDLAPALRAAGIGELFHMVVQPRTVGAGKPSPLVYARIITAASCVPGRVLSIGPNITNDVTAPLLHGLQGLLLHRPDIAYPPLAEGLPRIRHLTALPIYLGYEAAHRPEAGGWP